MSYYKLIVFIFYISVSIYLFFQVYETSKMIIDEEFHLRQGMYYCNGNFTVWDPKITTFPGLYLASTMLFLPFNSCSTFTLRLTSLLASIVNVWFIYEIRKLITRPLDDIKTSFETLTISFLPPMYFFAHLYYTDVLSLTTVLGLVLFNMKNEHNIAALFGFASVIMRQTNIVWVGMCLGITVMDKFVSQTLPFIKGNEKIAKTDNMYTFHDILQVIGFYCKRFYLIPKQIKLLASYLIGYILVITLFVVFVIVNGSIVVGDKSAHEASLHLPQLMYFSIFATFFGSSLVLPNLRATIITLRRKWFYIILTITLFAIIVKYNTLVHPYLLADNRHYTFAVWNKFYGKYPLARYAMTPVYVFCMISLYKSIDNKSAGFKLIYIICAIAAIAFQKLIEVRYFIVPFMLIRLNANQVKFRYLMLEFFSYLFVNGNVFMIFFHMEVYWSDYKEVQRIIW